jgi:hypothetical protein
VRVWDFEVQDAWAWNEDLDAGHRAPLEPIGVGADPVNMREPLAPWEEHLRWPRVYGRAPKPASLKNSGPETR